MHELVAEKRKLGGVTAMARSLSLGERGTLRTSSYRHQALSSAASAASLVHVHDSVMYVSALP